MLYCSYSEALDALKPDSLLMQCRPDLKGTLKVFLYQAREEIDEMDSGDELQREEVKL
jgi:hypothetical protein